MIVCHEDVWAVPFFQESIRLSIILPLSLLYNWPSMLLSRTSPYTMQTETYKNNMPQWRLTTTSWRLGRRQLCRISQSVVLVDGEVRVDLVSPGLKTTDDVADKDGPFGRQEAADPLHSQLWIVASAADDVHCRVLYAVRDNQNQRKKKRVGHYYTWTKGEKKMSSLLHHTKEGDVNHDREPEQVKPLAPNTICIQRCV